MNLSFRRVPLPQASCEHVIAGSPTAARMIREQVMLNVCDGCWARQYLLRVTVDGKLVVITPENPDSTAWANKFTDDDGNEVTLRQIAGSGEDDGI